MKESQQTTINSQLPSIEENARFYPFQSDLGQRSNFGLTKLSGGTSALLRCSVLFLATISGERKLWAAANGTLLNLHVTFYVKTSVFVKISLSPLLEISSGLQSLQITELNKVSYHMANCFQALG